MLYWIYAASFLVKAMIHEGYGRKPPPRGEGKIAGPPPFPGHTHTQLPWRLTTLKIAVQSMLDLPLHQSHTCTVVIHLSAARYSYRVTAAALKGRNPALQTL